MLKIEVSGDNVNVLTDGSTDGVNEMIRDALMAVAGMVDAIKLKAGLDAAEAFLLYARNMDAAGAFTIRSDGEEPTPHQSPAATASPQGEAFMGGEGE